MLIMAFLSSFLEFASIALVFPYILMLVNPNAIIFSVEGWPSIETVIPQLKAKKIKNVTLMPMMMVAGDHANNDMAGDEDDSYKSILQAEGFKVDCYLHGMGENEGLRGLFVERANDAYAALVK